MTTKALILLPVALLLSACGKDVAPLITQFNPVAVAVPSACPERAVGADLIASRPNPLRNQARPPDASVRSALSQAQLGMYEAEGGWADKVVTALKRCQQ